MNYHEKSGASSLKMERVMINFVIWRPFFLKYGGSIQYELRCEISGLAVTLVRLCGGLGALNTHTKQNLRRKKTSVIRHLFKNCQKAEAKSEN